MADLIDCPFCGFEAAGEYQIMLHLETLHPEGGPSPFVPTETVGEIGFDEKDSEQTEYVECDVPGCGEQIMLTEIETHIMLHEFEDESDTHVYKKQKIYEGHVAITGSFVDENIPPSAEETSRAQNAIAAWKKILSMPEKAVHKSTYRRLDRRLGKSELGPYAHEDQMPSWLVKLLEADGPAKQVNKIGSNGKLAKVPGSVENWGFGIIPVISQLLEQDDKTEYAYICQPNVLHISKLKREGGFCGYRNIQMLVSNMAALRIPGHEAFDGQIPTIFQIQDLIENAWDMGIMSSGREETGGIKGTRKYIGTPDAQAMLQGLGISCTATAYKGRPPKTALEYLFEDVEKYFASGYIGTTGRKIRSTNMPSIYFQHPGHSTTIIGIEKKTSGAINLLVFDPMFHDSEKITKHIGKKYQFKAPEDLLRAYRRGSAYLMKYKGFETLRLNLPFSRYA